MWTVWKSTSITIGAASSSTWLIRCITDGFLQMMHESIMMWSLPILLTKVRPPKEDVGVTRVSKNHPLVPAGS